MNDELKPYTPMDLTEKLVTHFSQNNNAEGISEEELKEVIQLQAEIAEVFCNHNTSLGSSYVVLSAMAESVYATMILNSAGLISPLAGDKR